MKERHSGLVRITVGLPLSMTMAVLSATAGPIPDGHLDGWTTAWPALNPVLAFGVQTGGALLSGNPRRLTW